MKFYDCITAPSPRLVRIFIAEKDLEIQTQYVDLRNGEHLTPEFSKINPFCTVPVLETDDGTRLTSTQGCWRYLEEKFPEPPLLGTTASAKATIADLVWRIETDGFHAVGEGLRNLSPGLKDRALTGARNFAQIPQLGERGKERARTFLNQLDGMIGDKEFLTGDQFTAADIIMLVVVDFARWIKVTLPSKALNADRWYQSVSSRPSTKL